jgi:putative transposase
LAAISFKRHRFPPDVIRYAVWLYLRFTLSLRDVEELLAQRGIDASYETIRCWVAKFGPQIAANLKKRRVPSSARWHLDEMVCRIGGKRMYLWRAVDDEGEMLDIFVHPYRDGWTAVKFLMQLVTTQPLLPDRIVTDGWTSYAYALRVIGLDHLHQTGGRRQNNRAENSHLPIRRRERKMMGFKSRESTQRFLTSHAAVYNNFNTQRHLTSRRTLKVLRAEAFETWQRATCA